MIVRGAIGSDLQLKGNGQKKFYVFRLAENHGKDENRTTTWFEVMAFIEEAEADVLAKGAVVEVKGRLEAKPWTDGTGATKVDLKIITGSVSVVPKSAA